MAGETIITIVGNLTRDPELRTLNNGSVVVNFTIASSERRFNRDTNQWEDGDTLFLNCSAWDTQHAPLASNIANSLAKGMTVIAQGRLTQRTYETETHEKRTVVELRVDQIGPSLRRAAAQVARQQNSNAGQFGGFGQPAGYTDGSTASSGTGVSDPFTTSGDPWGVGGFGSGGTDTGEPEF